MPGGEAFFILDIPYWHIKICEFIVTLYFFGLVRQEYAADLPVSQIEIVAVNCWRYSFRPIPSAIKEAARKFMLTFS
ncbi:MAG TPA: hypothetical protein PKC25_12630, partial [Candidatus Rifleibacterium sp.]|nr:hypothetical protein [Candidatus Rifleibacterium sp.]